MMTARLRPGAIARSPREERLLRAPADLDHQECGRAAIRPARPNPDWLLVPGAL